MRYSDLQLITFPLSMPNSFKPNMHQRMNAHNKLIVLRVNSMNPNK